MRAFGFGKGYSRGILMLKCRRVGAALAGVVLAGCTIAQAASGHPVSQTVALAALRHSADYPSPGSGAVYTGTVRSKLGHGAIVDRITITGHPKLTIFTFKGTSTGFYSHGTSRSRITGLATVRRDGSVALVGHGHYTGGTDAYRRVRGSYSFTGTAPALPPIRQPPACAVPAGWKVVASDAEVVVVLKQPDLPIQEYRYCNYAHASLGFQLLARNDDSHFLAGAATYSTVDGVALSYVLYDSVFRVDSPGCGGLGAPSDVYALDTSSGRIEHLWQGSGQVASASLAPTGVGAWLVNDTPCQVVGPEPRQESLQSFDFATGSVTTLDTGDPNETPGSPVSLANLELYPCAAGCPANTTVVAWTHDGAWRYAQVG
jgi:hypothetical protein